jgi:hypothetical protein
MKLATVLIVQFNYARAINSNFKFQYKFVLCTHTYFTKKITNR